MGTVRSWFTPIPALLFALTACGDDSTDTDTGDGAATTSVPAEMAGPDGIHGIDGGNGAGNDSDAEDSPTPEADLPGEPVERPPYEGAELDVVGVEADDTLNLRAAPGTDFDVVLELDPLATGITASGHNRSLDDGGTWAEVTVDGQAGWANTSFLLGAGQAGDITEEVITDPANPPAEETMTALGLTVADIVTDLRAGDSPEGPEATVVDGPVVDDDRGEVTVDLIGYPDDAVAGERLHVTGHIGPDGETFITRRVESTVLCARGTTDDALCV